MFYMFSEKCPQQYLTSKLFGRYENLGIKTHWKSKISVQIVIVSLLLTLKKPQATYHQIHQQDSHDDDKNKE